MRKVINIEDNICKHAAISRVLKASGIEQVSLAGNAETGISMIEDAVREGEPFELLVLDMNFCVNGKDEPEAGLYVIEELKKRELSIPIIVCSSLRLKIPEAAGCVFYKENRNWEDELKELLKKIDIEQFIAGIPSFV